MSDKPECITLKETAKYLYIDSGRATNFDLTSFDVERLRLAHFWIGKLLDEHTERERGRNAA